MIDKVDSANCIREQELPAYDVKIAFTQKRMNLVSKFLVSDKHDRVNR